MKKKSVWILFVTSGGLLLNTLAEVVITSPTGFSDESDVVLESAVDAVRALPSDTVTVVGDAVSYTADELRNTYHGVRSAFKGDTPREENREGMLCDVVEAWDASDDVLMRTYSVSGTVGSQMVSPDNKDAIAVDVRDFLMGVEFPEGTSAFYRPQTKQLVVFNTQAGLRATEEILARNHHAERNYKQVEVEAKFIEVSQKTLNQLGFTWELQDDTRLFDDWVLDGSQNLLTTGLRAAAGAFGGAPAAGTMTLTKSGWMPLSVVISALEQADDSDVLSAPSLTTMDGKSADIWVGERRNVPKAFSVNSTEVNVHIEHKDWDSEIMGVQFQVKPSIEKNNQIRLVLNPKVIDLVGYDTYQVSPQASMLMVNGFSVEQTGVDGAYPILNVPAAGITTVWDLMTATLGVDVNSSSNIIGNNPAIYSDKERPADHENYGVRLAPVQGRLPYFRVREIDTEVVVADGSTVGLGGLIYDRLETYKDKVPVLGSIPLLGRLFRSEGERSIKRNLMIFVSATQVDSNGQRKADLVSN
ncbi:MAG: hypothetical protein JEZ10_00650 [Verrucomicrobia bacterium]|nr:hypothetical protein [Verrucomicrobiota bacterium]